MMDSMFTHTGLFWIHQIAALIEGRSLHAALYAFDQPDVLGLQYLIDESDGLHFSIGGCVGFKKEIKFANEFLSPYFENIIIIHLIANSLHERTLIAKNKIKNLT